MRKLLFSFFLMVLLVGSGTISEMQAQTWNSTTTPDGWRNNAKWLPNTGFPNAIDATANLTNNVATDPTVVTLNAVNGSTANNVIVGTLNIGDSDGSAAISVGGGTSRRVIFDVSSGSAALNLTSSAKGGGHQFSASLQLNDNLVVTINKENASFSFNHSIYDASGEKTLTLTSTVATPGACNFGAEGNNYQFAKVIVSGNFKFNNTRSADDRAFGKVLSSYVADAITLDAGFLQAGGDNTYPISVNRGITLGAGGGTFHTPGASRKWEISSIITGSGGLTISGTAGSSTKLNAVNDYSGATSIADGGSLILGASGSINSTPQISLAAGATFDVSAIADYTLSSSTTLSAAGAATAATIKGGTTVSLGSQAVNLTYTPATFDGDATRPALTISQGALTLSNNTISVNNVGGTALGIGTYRLIAVTGGTINGTPNATVTVSGSGLAANTVASLVVSGGYVNLVVTSNAATYNVTYDGNGNEGGTIPSSQTKIEDTPLTLQSNSGNLTISGKNFNGWNTASDGSGTDYAAGGTYEANAAVTLFAKWLTVDTYTISFDGNGNTGGTAPGNQTKTQNVTQNIPLTLATNSGNLVKTGYSFAGWNTAADGSGTSYAAGGSFTTDAITTLYANWLETVTETFDSEALVTAHGWKGSGNTGSGSGGNDFKFSNTGNVLGTAGEAGGSFARSASFRYFANTTIGSYSRTNALKMSGSFKLNNQDFDGSFYIGYFKTGAEATNFAGITISEPSGAAGNPFRSWAAVNITGPTSSAMIELSQGTTYSFDLTWVGNADGSGTLSGTVAGTPVNVAVAAGSGTFDAFGLFVGGNTDNSANNTINCFFDDLTYNMNSQTAEWNGSAWSNGGPNSYKSAVVSGNISTTGFTTNNLTVNAGNNLTLTSGTLAVQGNLMLKSTDAGTATFVKSGGTLTVDGTTSVEQHLTAGRQWWYLSSPLSAATSNVIRPAESAHLIGDYSEATTSYSLPFAAGSGTALTAGKGYVVKFANTDARTITFTGGVLNDGDVAATVTRTGTSAAKRGFNLIGNPYSSYIDWDVLHGESTNMRDAVWFRTYDSGMTFHTYGDGDGVPEVTSPKIAPMQAFWVKVQTDGSDGTLTFKNTHRSQFVSGNNPLKVKAAENRQRLRMTVSNGIAQDEMLIVGKSYATNGLDTYDIEKMSNASASIPEIYSLVQNEELVINSMNELSAGAAVILGIRPGQAGSFTLKVTQLENINDKVYLVDHLSNTETELGAGMEYSFTSDATVTNGRFSVEFRAPGVSTSMTEPNAANTFVFVNEAKQISVQSVAGKEALIKVYNTAGQQLASQQATGSVTVIPQSFNAGIYLVKVNNHLQKVVIK